MGVEYKDYYKLLGVARTASKDEIKRAFKKMARQSHPDLNPDDEAAEARFKDINEAYEVLKDEEKRKLYDQLGSNWQHGQNFQRPPGFENAQFNFGGGGGFQGGGFEGAGFSDFFSNLFGGGGNFQSGGFGQDPYGFGQQRQRRGRDVESVLALSLEEAYQGDNKTITLQDRQSLQVKIPAGVKEGARIRLVGKGQPGAAGQPGDLFLRIKLLPHQNFTLDENNVIYDLNLAPWEAALGVKVRIPTLDGEVDLKIPAGSSSGKKLRLRDKGMGKGADKGDQFIRVNIRVPEELSEEEKALWEKLQDISAFNPR